MAVDLFQNVQSAMLTAQSKAAMNVIGVKTFDLSAEDLISLRDFFTHDLPEGDVRHGGWRASFRVGIIFKDGQTASISVNPHFMLWASAKDGGCEYILRDGIIARLKTLASKREDDHR